jgi:hypothetical protein
MKRLLCLMFAFTGVAVGALHAAPARLPYRPEKVPEPPPQPAQLDLRGTTWRGSCFDIPCLITLEPDGKLTYRVNKNDTNTSPGFWRVAGDQLVFEINQFSEHRGPIVGNSVQGESSNKSGMRGKFQLQRVPPGE